MARPFLAHADFVNKAAQDRADEINTCIGCNQACLDHIFQQKISSCLVNPRACHETELNIERCTTSKKLAVVGAGPAGLAAAIIGAGRIGFYVAEYLVHSGESTSQNIPAFMQDWGVDMTFDARTGVEGVAAEVPAPAREVCLMQRKGSKVGASLGKTTGWIHRMGLKNRGVMMLSACEYYKIDDDGLHVSIAGEPQVLDVDNVIICAGQ